MPLLPGRENIGKNIKTEMAAGKSREQAVAIAMAQIKSEKKPMAMPKAGDHAAMRSPYGRVQRATDKPTKSDEREKPIGRKGLVSGKY